MTGHHKFKKTVKVVSNQGGQGLIEYLIIVALMGVATIAIVRTMNAVLQNQFLNITSAMQGEERKKKIRVDERSYQKRDLGDFMKGTGDSKSGSENSSNDNQHQ
jgi:Flp pilus assembly pilin Flp